MESEYDRKFEDMKKYIPFLESMIKRLESTSSLSANPRQAQLDKIRSLRDLLLDKKKRMKMENLLKCEQVLINLYAKVEQRDTLPKTKKNTNSGASDSSKMENNSQLEIVRNKLKRVSKIHDEADTLPEIVRASDIDDVCTAGSVEPALFQRRPHKKSPTLSDISSSSQEKVKPPEINSKRKYTRVLVSPDRDSRIRSASQESSLDSVLFSRRSPKRSPKRSSSSHSKKEAKKISSNKTSSKKTKDLNITLNVPEESLNSLNTKDILSRIITCNDNDVDIATLRGLRTQILGELKQTGANDDISDLILKSYTGKKPTQPIIKKEEIEEGELSDSESEAIESIYGSLVLVDKDKAKSEVKSVPEKDQPRKIQICLVINSKDSESSNKDAAQPNQNINDECDLEMFNEKESTQTELKSEQSLKIVKQKSKSTSDADNKSKSNAVMLEDDDFPKDHESPKANTKNIETKNTVDKPTSAKFKTSFLSVDKKCGNIINIAAVNVGSPSSSKQNDKMSDESVQFKANFYKPLQDEENAVPSSSKVVNKTDNYPPQLEKHDLLSTNISGKNENPVEIPLLHEPVMPQKPVEKEIDSQIDILQALKNEILGDNILSGLDVISPPPLHQPKVTKVASAQGIMPKKRISIEKYKEKTAPTLNSFLSSDILTSPLRDDNVKKQSLKLTEKECERFNFPAKIDINDDVSSEDEGQKRLKMPSDDVYTNFAPKSPDNDDTHFVEKTQPVIIPIDPVKAPVISFKADIDMRTIPGLSPKETIAETGNVTASSSDCPKNTDIKKNEQIIDKNNDAADRNQSPLMDPRMRRDLKQSINIDSPNLGAMNLDRISKSVTGPNINFAPNLTPSMTPNSRSYEMTSGQQTFDFDGNSPSKHVYAPTFPLFESRDSKESSVLNDVCSPRDAEKRQCRWNDEHDSRSNISQPDINTQRSRFGDTFKHDKNTGKNNDRLTADTNDDSVRTHGSMTPLPLFGWSENSPMPNAFGRLEGPMPLMMNFRPDCPTTPSHPFGRTDCPPALGHPFSRSDMPLTPNHPFGRTDCPMTPSHPFGRTDCPTTPIHPFGRSDCPATPSHPFGRSDMPPTPSHMFGRSDCPTTPSHPFGRIDCPPTSSNPYARVDFPTTPSHPFGRSDCPTTPSHPFGRSDCPTTPSHPFGRSDCPPTPSHPFGRLECPQTPSHPFGVSECPNTPSHPFGRVDSFGRTEQSQNIAMNQQFSKDPRLNRRSEYESRPHREERENRHYNDRGYNAGSYKMHNRSFSRLESYTNYDRELNDGGRSKSMSRSERNFRRARSRESDIDQSSFVDKGGSYNYDNRSRCRERGTEERYRRERSVGRIQDSHENFVRSKSRADSVSRNNNEETTIEEINNDNTLSVKSHAGRSFTIDTSVNSTFQDLLKKKGLEILDQSFDSRKKRAASVGRSEVPSFNRGWSSKNISGESVTTDDMEYRSKNYRRASSVGRDVICDNNDKFYQKVKTDFKKYKTNLIMRDDEKQRVSKNTEDNQRSKRHYDDNNGKSNTTKQPYSPRKNNRDPRMRRDYDDKNGHWRGSGYFYDKKKHGFIYSNDNIARGAVLGSGYGVKNYKIPKIKRPINENQDKEKQVNEKLESDETKIKKSELKAIKDTGKQQSFNENLDVSEDSPGRRLTRSSEKYKNVEVKVSSKDETIKIRKQKKAVIFDSSSDTETTNKDTGDNNVSSDDEKLIKIKYSESKKRQESVKELKPKDSVDFDNEIFSDNVVSDPVIDNINALIADLDNHIDTSKNEIYEDFSNDINFDDDLSNTDKLLLLKELNAVTNEDIGVQRKNKDESQEIEQIKENIDSCIETTSKALLPLFNKSTNLFQEIKNLDSNESQIDDVRVPIGHTKTSIDDKNDTGTSLQNFTENKTKLHNEAIVSTTDNDKENSDNLDNEVKVKHGESIDVNYETSVADSTNEVTRGKTKEHNIPDSTNDVQSEMNSLVSSSLSSADNTIKDSLEPSLSRQDAVPPLDSIGSLLSILQDKSKIHQLLSMLREQSGDHEKIKRKLEKLSEIVCDDEEEIYDKIANKTDNMNVSNSDHTLEVCRTVVDENAAAEILPSAEVTDTKLENTVPSSNDDKHIDKDVNDTLVQEQPEIEDHNDSLTIGESEPIVLKKGKGSKRNKGKYTKKKKAQQVMRAVTVQVEKTPTAKKPSRELLKLREDIKEMFLTDEMLNSTGIRMCRLAKLVDEKNTNRKEEATQPDPKPVVVLEKFKDPDKSEESLITEKPTKKKPLPKIKRKSSANEDSTYEENKVGNTNIKTVTKNLPVTKSKTKISSKQEDADPYEFETDSIDTSTVKESESEEATDSESNSLASSKSFGSSEILADLQKKTKRKRRGKAWQTGIIKPKSKKKKQLKQVETSLDENTTILQRNIVIPDKECFVDKFYCFQKNVTTYSCRLCVYTGDDIILHYKNQHPHTEIPLSRMNPVTAKEAIEQCQEVNFPAISKISTDRYVCRFCFKDISKTKAVLETFFWHVVSVHTGEYKQTCSECVNQTCHYNLDIPPPPKDNKGQLIGYLCGKCNFTQVSLENLKTHVIGRHNDEQTDVYTINLAAMSKKTLKSLSKMEITVAPRVLRSSRSNQSIGEPADDHNEIDDISPVTELIQPKDENILETKTNKKGNVTSMQSKIAFESEDNITESNLGLSENDSSMEIKQESFEIDSEEPSHLEEHVEPEVPETSGMEMNTAIKESQLGPPDDVMAYAHFKVRYKESGVKEYVCCITGKDNHYKTTLLISMRKHVQSKHDENWDGYCVVCKVIVMPQGTHLFKDCLQHFLDKHMGEFPLMETANEIINDEPPPNISSDIPAAPKPYINVRPLDQLISGPDQRISIDNVMPFPKIESVVSLGAVELPRSSPNYPSTLRIETQEEKQYRYEEWQAEVMSKKHRVVLNTMMSEEKLVKVYKCTGRFCSFASDNAEDALLHATTHQRIGGEGALNCSYCDFDASSNGIDLVMHVFKAHGKCPYACRLCFYRAAASQLVSAHISRVHSEKQSADSVLHTTTVAMPVTDDSANLMLREDAVPSYVCGHTSSEGDAGACKFRTYTPAQFCDHLQQRHKSPHPCSMCSNTAASASELAHHMKTHGHRLYHCTFCVFGADNEADLLAHASAHHPEKLPQAYLRVITNKDGSSELRVLPRAFLNKSRVPSKDVTPGGADDAVREAKRCIELEKLIGHIEAVTAVDSAQAAPEANDDITDDNVILDNDPLLTTESEALDRPSASTPLPTEETYTKSAEESNVSTSVVKTEPGTDMSKTSDDVICLDSDEEEPRARVIDLSDEDPINTPADTSSKEEKVEYRKVPMIGLFKCPKCKTNTRSIGGFKRHLGTCVVQTLLTTQVKCPHSQCTRMLANVTEITEHYFDDHSDRKTTVYACGFCKAKFNTAALTKKHMREQHKSYNYSTNPVAMTEGRNRIFTIIESLPKTSLKRKLSSDAGKPKRYGTQDIDQLPINPILDNLVYCSLCEFNTKVRLNMVRHLQLHAGQQPVPQTAPVNPVPHLETNERHFDKMVNLASSSIINRAPEKLIRSESALPVTLITPEAASRYPRYIPDRQRYTCGAKGCSYISVDEAMLRCHWETLHSNTNDYHCVHCPPHQHLDTSRPLTAVRIIGHLKMHDSTLYACTSCSYYHHNRTALEKHLSQVHREGQIMIVREEGVTPTPSAIPAPAPTMDLKPWQCGVCKFKSMLRPEVVEHCSKVHQSKMQFKCSYCPFRTSTIENVTKHQTNSHPDKGEDVFYYYYREGSIPDEDGIPRWVKQKEKIGNVEPVVKAEVPEPSTSQCAPSTSQCVLAAVTATSVPVDLNLVKQEAEDTEIINDVDESIEGLCKRFGQFCEPNGSKYKCPLCTAIAEDTAEAMQSHLYEELKYRKWGCSVCSYKAFHKAGLSKHITSEHRRQYKEPIELPTDMNIEKWVAGLLEYQTNIIGNNKQDVQKPWENLPTTSKADIPVSSDSDKNENHLEQAFGSFGTPRNTLYCCPKCSCALKDEGVMKEHLESELSKIRWCCSNCPFKSQNYHEAQFHCKSTHTGESARPVEAVRDPALRAAWVETVLHKQKLAMKTTSSPEPVSDKTADTSDTNENSLLVVRYEERVPPEDVVRRKRTAPADSDDEKLVIDESEPVKKNCKLKTCSYCDFKTKWSKALREHVLRHYDLKPLKCTYCDFNGYRPTLLKHIESYHPGKRCRMEPTPMPTEQPHVLVLQKQYAKKVIPEELPKVICLHCEILILEKDVPTHVHENIVTEFGRKGDVVVKCCICLALRLDVRSLQDHHDACHADVPINYAFFKLHCDSRHCYYCRHCSQRFSFLRDLRSHHKATHGTLQLKYTAALTGLTPAEEELHAKRKSDDFTESSPKRVAKKSTTKLPFNTVAKKSTSKLPFSVSDLEMEEYSFYGNRATSIDEYAHVSTLMPFCNTLLPFTVKKLREIIKIEPYVLVNDFRK